MAKAKSDATLDLIRLYARLNVWLEMERFTLKQQAILSPQILRLEKKVKAEDTARLANRTKEA